MPAFLSESWVAALDAELRALTDVTTPDRIVIEQVVHDVPERGEVRYQVRIDPAGARIDHDGNGPDVRVTTDYGTAAAIARGEETAQIALARGRLQLGGDVDSLVRFAATLAAVAGTTAALRSATTFASS